MYALCQISAAVRILDAQFLSLEVRPVDTASARASVKLFELGVYVRRGIYFGRIVPYQGYRFSAFFVQAFRFSA